jgi:hypothetical protein
MCVNGFLKQEWAQGTETSLFTLRMHNALIYFPIIVSFILWKNMVWIHKIDFIIHLKVKTLN